MGNTLWDEILGAISADRRGDATPEELAKRREGYANAYQNSFLARNRDKTPISVQGAKEAQDFLPLVGDALAMAEAGDALSRGEIAAAGLLGAGALVGLVPAAGDALAKPVMAAGRRAADVARRIEVDPTALGSMGGNIRLRPQASPAQEVAGLLSSGRANDVTDDMLAKLTPQDEAELFKLYESGATGVDMQMDQVSRMARADAAGFDTESSLYHGTTAPDFAEFNPSNRGRLGAGVYFTPNPNLANTFAGASPTDVRLGEPALNRSRVFDSFTSASMADDAARSAAGKARREAGIGTDAGRIAFQEALGEFGGVSVADEVTVLDPANIRSRFARFDPRLSHLKNLSAGIAGLGLLGSLPDINREAQQ